MPRHASHYQNCYFGSLYPVLEVNYRLADAKDFSQLQIDVVQGVADYESSSGSHLNYRLLRDQQDASFVTLSVKKIGKHPLNGADVKSLSHALAGAGALKADDRLLLENYINGVTVQPPPPARPPATGTAATPSNAGAPATTINRGAIHGGYPTTTASPKAAGTPSPKPAGTTLTVPYMGCSPLFANGMLYLNYEIAGATANNQATRGNVMQLNRAIQQAAAELNNKLPAPGLHVTVAAPYPINNGADCCVNVRIKNNPPYVMRALTLTEIFAVADELQAAGALQPADYAALIGNSQRIVGAQQAGRGGNAGGQGRSRP